MEEDILSKFRNIVEESREECIYDYYIDLRNTLELLENLINRNKELEEEDLKIRAKFILSLDDYIPKSELQELLDIDEIDVVHCRLKRLLGDDN